MQLKTKWTSFVLLVMATLSGLVVSAQEKGADINVDINKGGGSTTWYTSPWVWIVGGAIFILLLVALLRGNNSRG